ncbi:MAG: hypothetical protein GXZ11_01555 [Tissierellia bacterium]|nr:hypothetical protein [Tissierellia bacterium]
MKKLLVTIILIITIVLSGCANNIGYYSNTDSFNPAVNYIHDMGVFHDYMDDSDFKTLVDDGVIQFMKSIGKDKYTWSMGLLDESNVPYIVIYIERIPSNIGDPGELILLAYDNKCYSIIQSLEMNYDNSNYNMVIGKVSENHNGLILSNNIGIHAGYTYCYYWNGQQLSPMISDRHTNLYSAFPSSKVSDINNDGILDWSIISFIPESLTRKDLESDTMEIWYTWDNLYSAKVLKVIRKDSVPRIDESIYSDCLNTLRSNPEEFLPIYKKSIALLNKYDATTLLTNYIEFLSNNLDDKSKELKDRVSALSLNEDIDHTLINRSSYLNSKEFINNYSDIKDFLNNNLSLGYFVNTHTKPWSYDINYPMLQDAFGDLVLQELDDYLTIRGYEITDPSVDSQQNILVSLETLAERIIMTDTYVFSYPYSSLRNYILLRNEWYARLFFFGTVNDTPYDKDTSIYFDSVLNDYSKIKSKYPLSFLSENIQYFLESLENNNNRVHDELYLYMDEEYGI